MDDFEARDPQMWADIDKLIKAGEGHKDTVDLIVTYIEQHQDIILKDRAATDYNTLLYTAWDLGHGCALIHNYTRQPCPGNPIPEDTVHPPTLPPEMN